MANKKIVSYSQYTTYHQCPQKYKLKYIDKLGTKDASIELVFGNALHETIQEFLKVMYNESKKKAMEHDWDNFLQERMVASFKEFEKSIGKAPCTAQELMEFYQDGCNIVQYFKGKIKKFYPKQGFELVGIEYKLEKEIKPNIIFWGFIDIVLRDIISGKIS